MAHIACLILCSFAIVGWFLLWAILKLASYCQRNVFAGNTERRASKGDPLLYQDVARQDNLHETRRAILRSLAFRGFKFPTPHHSPDCTDKEKPRPARNDPRLGALLFTCKTIKRF